ncbi:hypothetical protein [Geobacter pickeringii]|uniref:Uncharacterized protein n=1 Tax=Geobacter pickeringii TaxID=345632 RepID=A0A0B5BJJ3_9BACT|nr:hypothetical protein [Geobacter pickeringii]AJE04675.1 hypothetical protein GPICK_16020 [Geobacter pickeringii]
MNVNTVLESLKQDNQIAEFDRLRDADFIEGCYLSPDVTKAELLERAHSAWGKIDDETRALGYCLNRIREIDEAEQAEAA